MLSRAQLSSPVGFFHVIICFWTALTRYREFLLAIASWSQELSVAACCLRAFASSLAFYSLSRVSLLWYVLFTCCWHVTLGFTCCFACFSLAIASGSLQQFVFILLNQCLGLQFLHKWVEWSITASWGIFHIFSAIP